MKNFRHAFTKLTLLTGLLLTLQSGLANAQVPPSQLVSLHPDHVFTPTGFDSNDNSQVVIEGMFSSTCFKVGPVKWSVDLANHRIAISNTAYYYDGPCLRVLVPYQKTIDLGRLLPGQYSLWFEKSGESFTQMGELNIKPNTSASPDEYMYAPVTEAIISLDNKTPILVLSGTVTNTCMKLQTVRLLRTKKDVVEVLPITAMTAGKNCKDIRSPFTVTRPLPPGLEGTTLVHIRSLNGKSINLVYDF